MKHFNQISFLLLISLLLSTNTFCQEYQSIFGIESTKWQYPFCNLDQAEILEKVSNETVILDNVFYHRIGTPNSGTINYSLVPFSGNAIVREDTQNGRVWYTGVIETIQGYDTVEFLIMDLSLQEGESFVVHEMFGDQDISIVDSIYYSSGLKHVRTNYQHWSSDFPLTFIEGVGTNYGLAYMHDHYNLCSCLISLNKDAEITYFNNACNPPTVTVFEEVRKPLRMFPNPASKKITISNLAGNGEFVITNILGESIKKGSHNKNDLTIDVTDLKNNIYFIEIDGSIMKFIKE
ncbi:T9SS type A sorting domain-containing protein [Crocinitomicaceae bacterium]|nr:T9SS type A sorting domain-containing protein [Crocinitomicaceae bacterium]